MSWKYKSLTCKISFVRKLRNLWTHNSESIIKKKTTYLNRPKTEHETYLPAQWSYGDLAGRGHGQSFLPCTLVAVKARNSNSCLHGTIYGRVRLRARGTRPFYQSPSKVPSKVAFCPRRDSNNFMLQGRMSARQPKKKS